MATKAIESVLQENRVFPPSPAFARQAALHQPRGTGGAEDFPMRRDVVKMGVRNETPFHG